jgi:hypothetical protein
MFLQNSPTPPHYRGLASPRGKASTVIHSFLFVLLVLSWIYVMFEEFFGCADFNIFLKQHWSLFQNNILLETSERDGASSRNFSVEKYPCSRGILF